MSTENKNTISVESTIHAPVEKVWEYWTAPEHITQWCFATPEWHAPEAQNDVRTGGKFSTTMAARDGSFSFDFGGIYTDVKEHELIEYALTDNRKVKITFSAEGDNTKVVETFDPEDTNPLEMQRGGWQAILDNFRKYTEAN